jgi:glycosyltransferase involved in cell wall biosynthesis
LSKLWAPLDVFNDRNFAVIKPVFHWVSAYTPEQRGGYKSTQANLLQALEAKLGTAHRIAPVKVPEEFINKWFSRLQKKLHIPRRYAYYSESRLAAFAQAVHAQLPVQDFRPIVFFNPLPFVKCRPSAPYFVYTDGAFFIHYWEYNQDHSHAKKDIDRIASAEADFMRRSAGVWCSSQWVADRITRECQLTIGLAHCMGIGPDKVPSPIEPVRFENFLVMIAGDFERKGGRLTVESVAAARKLGVEVSIRFIGVKPPSDVLSLPFVEWCGWLDLKQDADRRRFAEVLSRAGAQILLSRSDLTPLVIPEAATYGKATLAAAVGGIPEMIRDGETGWLVRSEATSAEIGERIAQIFKEPVKLAQAGEKARAFCAAHWSWNSVGDSCLKSFVGRE